jgi:hypothetical protein
LISLAVAPLALGQGDGDIGPPSCDPCNFPGACPPTDPILSGESHRCENHAFHDHSYLVLSMVDLTQTKISSGAWTGSQLTGCTLHATHAYGIEANDLVLTGCCVDGISAMDADFKGSIFTDSTFCDSYLVRADFQGAVIPVVFAGATLAQADFSGAVLSVGTDMADFCNADLSDAVGLADTVGFALYSPCTDFSGTGFDPVAAGWTLVPGAPIGESSCDPAEPNSTGMPGVLTVYGCQQAGLNSVVLEATHLPTNQFGYFLLSQETGFVAQPGDSQGTLCLGGTIGRFVKDVRNTGALGRFELEVDLFDLPAPVQPVVFPGDTWTFQTFYRDNNPGPTTNFTQAVTVLFE